MADVLTKGTLFPEELVKEMFVNVKGKSALAALCKASPIPFNGQKEFTFTLDKEIDIVAESGAKGVGGGTITPRTIIPVKVEYGMRVSDEFLYANEEVKLDYLKAFSEGFAKKLARGIDIMAFLGANPRTNAASSLIGDNCFIKGVTQSVTVSGDETATEVIESGIALVQGSENEVNGLVISPLFRQMLAAEKNELGQKVYPELSWGGCPETVNGLRTEVSANIGTGKGGGTLNMVVGDFVNCFRWGYAKQLPIEIIKYGNPDNDTTLGDLKGHNQVYLRGEAYVGWGILAPDAFAIYNVTD